MTRAPLLLALLLGAALAGCASPAPAFFEPPPRTCGDAVRWRQPGLYDALPAAASGAGLPLEPQPSEASLPFTHADLTASDPGLTLSQVSLERAGAPYAWMSPWTPGEVRIAIQGHWTDPALLATFRAFLDEMGLGDAPERPAWERALVNGSRERWPPAVSIPAQPDLDGLYERLRPDLTEEGGEGPGAFELVGEGWRFGFRLPVRHVVLDETRVIVDARDRVSVSAMIPAGEPVGATLRQRADEAFRRLGLPAPAYPPLDPATDAAC